MRVVGAWGAVLLVGLLLPSPGTAHFVDVVVEPYTVQVDGEVATGWLAYPARLEPSTLLVVAHACCGHLSEDTFRVYENGFAARHGVAVVAMDYRGPGHWDVWTGHLDTIAATEALQARWPIERTVIWGLSMGGEVSGMAVAARPDLYDYWIDTLGVTDLYEEFLALGLYPYVPLVREPSPDPENHNNPVGSWILEETGGLPGVAPRSEWDNRSPVLHANRMVGLRHAYLNYNPGDFIVPVEQGTRMFDALRDAGVPATLCLGATREGYTQAPYGYPLPTLYAPMSHEWASMACTLDQLHALLSGMEPDAHRDSSMYVHDRTTGQTIGPMVPDQD